MNEAADEFGNEFQLGNPDIFGFDNHPSSDLMWTNFLESVGQQSEEPSSLSSPESIHFDGLSNVDHTTNNCKFHFASISTRTKLADLYSIWSSIPSIEQFDIFVTLQTN